MTGMLASVASLEEARIVLKQRVGIIDLKDPKLGALGALDQRIISSVVQLVNNLIPTSATIGDIKPNDIELSERIIMTANSGVSFIKVGLFDKNISENFIKIINRCGSENINIIIVTSINGELNAAILVFLVENPPVAIVPKE